MTYRTGRVWTPEKAIVQVPKHGVQHSRMFLRRSPQADNKAFVYAVCPLLPRTHQLDYGDAIAFAPYLGDLAYRIDSTNRIILALIEATVVVRPKTCITALSEGIRLATPENQLLERVIPIVVVDEERTHTQFEGGSGTNPDGPKQVFEEARRLGAITIKVTPETLRARVTKTVQDILNGIMPEV